MATHKFNIGDAVYLTATLANAAAPAGQYSVVRLLPADGHDQQYRIRSAADGHERMAKERHLGVQAPSRLDAPALARALYEARDGSGVAWERAAQAPWLRAAEGWLDGRPVTDMVL